MQKTLTITVDGKVRQLTADPGQSLLDAFREELRATGTPHRCGEGRCGGCVVLLDGRRVLACDTPVGQADGRRVETIPM